MAASAFIVIAVRAQPAQCCGVMELKELSLVFEVIESISGLENR